MKPNNLTNKRQLVLALLTAGVLAFPAALRSEVTDLARTPLADATTATVLPNMMFILDDSGSMGWGFMPDEVVANLASNCFKNFGRNKVYYNPTVIYRPPVDAGGNAFPNSSFNSAWDNGFDQSGGSPKTNLSTQFRAYDNVTSNGNGSDTAQPAYYYSYSFTGGSFTATNPPPDCQANARYTKVTVSATSGPGGTDERQNFANWYSYYRTRILTMKSSAGRAFTTVGDNYRVGFITINPGSPVAANKYLAIRKFDSTQRTAWYDKLYTAAPSGVTPLREALSRIGRHYGGVKGGINSGMSEDPVEYSCQQNFSLLTTDGFWNSNAGVTLTGGGIGNQDNVQDTAQPLFVTRASGTFDGNLLPGISAGNAAGGADTLADVAMYYYKTDLRPAGSTNDAGKDVSENNVPKSPKEPEVAHQRMITFTLGLGVNGNMTYDPNYEAALTGDFAKIRTASTGCSWQSPSAVCNWPTPKANDLSAIDDLWHAAVNGRGKYFSAQSPDQLTDGIASALSGVSARVGAAAASATSSPNITETSNFIFSTTYRTVFWDGEVVAQQIDTQTGNVIPTILWSARTALNDRASGAGDTRVIHVFDSSSGNHLKPFQWANLNAAEQNFFKNLCVAPFKLSQCDDLTVPPAPDLSKVNDGKNVVDFLRGQNQLEGSVFRDREFVLGDSVNGIPVFVKQPQFNFGVGDPTVAGSEYGVFKDANAGRQAMLYVAANDGMLHAFNADNGTEVWAFVPRQILPNLHKLADQNYSARHEYYVDGSPTVMDVFISGQWRTILVGSLNRGGRGYYALDVTNPSTPTALWEFCSDSTLCAISDTDLGFSYGNPVITKRASDGRWVVIVTSGYNNVSPGNGQGWLYVLDAATGAVLAKVSTGAGDTIAVCANLCGPSGLAKISAWADDFVTDPTSKWVYGGDLWGNLWRFDLQVSPPALQKIAELRSPDGKPQSVTTRPELGEIDGKRVIFLGTGRYLGVNDLADPSTLVPALPYAQQQSFYGIKDADSNWGNFRNAPGAKARAFTQTTDTTRSVTATGGDVNWSTDAGWYIDFNATDGERVNIDPILVLGTLVITTNIPNQNACTVGGDSWTYFLDYLSGSYVSTSPNQEAGYKRVGFLTVGNVVVRLPSGTLKLISTDITGGKSTRGIPVGASAGIGRRISWRELIK